MTGIIEILPKWVHGFKVGSFDPVKWVHKNGFITPPMHRGVNP